MFTEKIPTYTIRIWIAGDVAKARDLCREFCMEGLCVTVTETVFIYTGGAESGAVIGLINYPKIPYDVDTMWDKATRLGEHLRCGLYQHSFLIEGPEQTVWYSKREK